MTIYITLGILVSSYKALVRIYSSFAKHLLKVHKHCITGWNKLSNERACVSLRHRSHLIKYKSKIGVGGSPRNAWLILVEKTYKIFGKKVI